MDYNISFEWNPLLLIPAIILGLGLSYWLYQKDDRFSPSIRYALFGLRSILFAFLFILLVNPILKHFTNRVEKPVFVVALDNSKSLSDALSNDDLKSLKNQIKSLESQLVEKGIRYELIGLNSKSIANSDSLEFNFPKTNLSELLGGIEKLYDNRNLSGMLLVSDGLFNRGMSPLFGNYNSKIHVLGVGDTNSIKDVWINDLQYNEIAFVDNYYPLNVRVQQNGLEGEKLSLKVSDSEGVLKEETFSFSEGETLKTIEFKLLAKQKGQKRLKVEISYSEESDRLKANNIREAYLEIIDGRDKILIISMGPHPDIKAIKSALGTNNNYEIKTLYASENVTVEENYDLVIFHQIPNLRNLGNRFVRNFIEKNTPIWFILGPSSDYFELNRYFKGVSIRSQVRQNDDVIPLLNPDFSKYIFPENSEEVMFKLPPMKVPFANYELGEGSEVVLYQGLSKINTGKPLLAIQQTPNNKFAFLAGDELWSWRLYEYSNFENFDFTNAIIQKTVQYLSLKEDKRKFRLRLKESKNLFEGNPVVFQLEVYNEILEPVYGKEIKIQLKNESGERNDFSFINSANTNFEIKGLEPGVYSYTASTVIEEKEEVIKGQFSIRKMELESLVFKADHDLLKKVAARNNGIFVNELNENTIPKIIGEKGQGILHAREVNVDLISIFWLFFIILLIISTEWFVRKYSGAY